MRKIAILAQGAKRSAEALSRFDRIPATRMGIAAAEALLEGASGVLGVCRHNSVQSADAAHLDPPADPWGETLGHVHRITSTERPPPRTGCARCPSTVLPL